jgi:PAS domain-containing protein
MKISTPNLTVLVLALAAGVFFIIDPIFKDLTFVPLALSLGVLCLSFRLPPARLLLWSCIYGVLVLCVFTRANMFQPDQWQSWLKLMLRMSFFATACALGILYSKARQDLNKSLGWVVDVLGKMPVPLIVSDAAGYVVYANEEAGAFFRVSSLEIEGKRFVDLFMPDVEEGKAMRFYVEMFEDFSALAQQTNLGARGGVEKSVPARMMCMGVGSDRRLVTLLLPSRPPQSP